MFKKLGKKIVEHYEKQASCDCNNDLSSTESCSESESKSKDKCCEKTDKYKENKCC